MSIGAGAGIAERLSDVQARIEHACGVSGRSPGDVRIVAVTKTHPPGVVRDAVEIGVPDIGENRVQELTAKMDALGTEDASALGVRWHFVGRLQSNKASDVAGRVSLVHSVDRLSLVDALERHAGPGQVQRVLVQVNVGDDPRKGGCPPDRTLDLVAEARSRPALEVIGLMTIPPLPPEDADQEEHARPFFAELRRLRDAASDEWPEVQQLSMGMSGDLGSAVEEGATIVRVGTALLGARRDPPWDPESTWRTDE